MKTTLLTLTAVTALVLTACIPSINPFYTAKDVVFEPALLGEWTVKDSEHQPERWKFERSEGKDADRGYDLTVIEGDGKQGQFRATLFKLKEHRFLDLIPTDCDYATNQSDLVAFSMFPGHLLIHIASVDPELKMALCDFEWLGKHLEENPRALDNHNEDGRILLTASTKQLQRFVFKHLEGDELFSDYGELTKQQPSASH